MVVPVNPLQDPMNPYFLSSGDNPALSLVSKPLTANNYHSWARLMHKALVSKNKFKFVDGSIPKPSSFDLSYDAWERCNDIVHSWIVNSVSPQLTQMILYKELASEAWNVLKRRFARVDRVRVVDLQHELHQLKQKSLSVTEFFTELSNIWEELDTQCPMPDCTCPVKCTCESMRNARSQREEDYIMCFLKGLNDNFAMVKSQILLMKELPTIDEVFSMVLEHERQNGLIPPLEESQSLINAADGKRPYGRGKGNWTNKQCTFCGKGGHTVETCYRKHGYPAGYFNRDSKSSANFVSEDKDTKSDSDSSKAITQEELSQLLDVLKKVNVSKAPSGSGFASGSAEDHAVNQIHISTAAEGNPSIPTVYNCALVDEVHLIPWVLDSGATDHICNNLKMFDSYYNIRSLAVRLPNGNSICANKAGTIRINADLVLTDVLYLPEFNLNLVSIPKLAHGSNYHIRFADKHCFIQDHSQKMIGSGKLKQGLYHLDYGGGPTVSVVSNISVGTHSYPIPKSILWHYSFGHASHAKLGMMSKFFSDVCNNLLDSESYHSQLVLAGLRFPLNLFTWMFGDRVLCPVYIPINTFLLLLMITLALHGLFC